MKEQPFSLFLTLLGLLLATVHQLQAQYLPLDIPVTKQGQLLKNPWAGGLDAPQFSTVDLNNNGIKDLLVFDRYTNLSTTFINRGTPNQIAYEYAPHYQSLFVPRDAESFLLALDYNGDGVEDLFGIREIYGVGPKVAVWRGYRMADDSIRFDLVVNGLTYDGSPRGGSRIEQVFLHPTDLPGLGDVDGDGDVDFFSFSSNPDFPTNITFYENKAADNGHGLDTLEYYIGSDCWGLISEELDSAKVKFSPSVDSCYNNPNYNNLSQTPYQLQHYLKGRTPRHVGTNISLLDYNGDSHMDVVLSEIDFNNANLITSTTVNDTTWMISQQPQFPFYDKPIALHSFPSVHFLDVNNDGVKDMLAAPSDTRDGFAVNDSVGWYYQNVGSNSNMTFNFQQKDFLVNEMIDVGRQAHPVAADITGNGLQDLLIGKYELCHATGQYHYGLVLLINVGTPSQPAFGWLTNNFAGTDSLGERGLHPTLGDIDGDGDMDMLCGNENGTLIFFRNNAGPNQMMNFDPPVRTYANINLFSKSAPQWVDLDRDGDLDLAIGNNSGRIFYYENTGTPTNPIFSATPTTNNLGNYVAAFPNLRNATPHFYDHQGSYELIIGQATGEFMHLDSIDNNILGSYKVLSSNFNQIYKGKHAQLSVTDINNNGKVDYLIGTGSGGIQFLEKVDSFIATPKIAAAPSLNIQLYPNPAQEKVTIDCQKVITAPLQVVVYNALGQPLLQQSWQQGKAQQQISLQGLPSGVLWIELKGASFQQTLSLIKQ